MCQLKLESTAQPQPALKVFTGPGAFEGGWVSGAARLNPQQSQIGLHVQSASSQTNPAHGCYQSPIYESCSFSELIMSWNAQTPPGTTAQVQAQVRIGAGWSDWFSWGEWGDPQTQGSAPASDGDTRAKMNVDTLNLKEGLQARALRYRVLLTSTAAQQTPVVSLVAVSLNADTPTASQHAPKNLEADIDLDVPMLSQCTRRPDIAGRICSPTSLAMVLRYHGAQVTPEQVAEHVYDRQSDAYGNWPFNTAGAADWGMQAYVARLRGLEDLKAQLEQGRPVIVSVSYKNAPEVQGDFALVEGAPIASTPGHLIVVRGMRNKDGVDYVIVNDPAAPHDAQVCRWYRADQFERAWRGIAYIVYPKPEE